MFGLDEESKKVDPAEELQECFICNERRKKHPQIEDEYGDEYYDKDS
jgi:hypothetical protein